MFRVAILLKNGERITQNRDTKEECEDFILENMEKLELKRSVIVNKNNIKERWTEDF